MMVCVDGNGRLLGLGEKSSFALITTVHLLGIIASVTLGLKDRKRRLIAVAILVVYVLSALPMIIWC